MVMNKGAQFFLLAAVIISLVIISLGANINLARVSREPGSFYDFSYEVKREAGAVVDYEIYSGFEGDANLTQFVDLYATDIKDRDPNSDFLFIYGDNSSITLLNYGSEDVATSPSGGDSQTVPGAYGHIRSMIWSGSGSIPVDSDYEKYGSGSSKHTESALGANASVEVEVSGNYYSFPVSKHKQVIFIMKKSEGNGDERYITVK